MNRFLCFIFAVLYSLFSWGQSGASINFEAVDKGISNKWIYSIVQDSLGFMWIGTEDGLNRYDGYKFDILRNDPENPNSLPANYVVEVAVAPNNEYWLATRGGGFSVFSPDQNQFVNYAEDHQSNFYFIDSIKYLPNGNVVLVCDEGVFIYDTAVETYKKMPIGVSESRILVEDNMLWVSNKKELYTYHLVTGALELKASFNEPIILLDFVDGELLISLESNTFFFGQDGAVSRQLLSTRIKSLTKRNGLCYAASEKQLFQFNYKTKLFEKLKPDLPFKGNINTVYIDNQNLLWVGLNKGLYRQTHYLDAFSDISFNVRARRVLMHNGLTYAGGHDGLFVKKKDGTILQLIDHLVWSIAPAGNAIWVGINTGEVVKVVNNRVVKRVSLNIEDSTLKSIYGLTIDKQGRIWAGAWDGLHVLSEDGVELGFFKLNTDSSKGEAKIVQSIIDENDNLWIVTAAYGIFKAPEISSFVLTSKELSLVNYKHDKNDMNSITSNVLMSVEEDRNGVIWFGSDSGVLKYNEAADNFTRFKDGDKLFDKKIMAIRSDLNNDLWISTISEGLFLYNKNTQTLAHYTAHDGLISNAFLFSSGYLDEKENKLYFGTEAGVQQVDLNKGFEKSEGRSPIVVDFTIRSNEDKNELSIFSSPYLEEIELSYEESDFSIRFSNLDFSGAQKIRYAYTLNDKQWRTTDLQTAYFTNVPYGKHILKVKALYDNQTKNEVVSSTLLNIKINPPWYLTWWAYMLYILLFLFVLFIIFYLLLKKRLADSETKKAIEIDEIKSKMYANISHEFRTPLTVIEGLSSSILEEYSEDSIAFKKARSIKQNGGQLLNLVNQMLDLVSLDNDQMELNYKRGNVVDFLKQCVQLYNNYADSKKQDLRFETAIDYLEMDVDDDKLQKIINNLLSNAIKFTPEGGSIVLKFSKNDQNIVITLTDTGKGISAEELPKVFDRYYKTFDLNNNLGTGIGMSLTKELIELMSGSIVVESKLGKGTSFIIYLPIQNMAKSDSFIFQMPFLLKKE